MEDLNVYVGDNESVSLTAEGEYVLWYLDGAGNRVYRVLEAREAFVLTRDRTYELFEQNRQLSNFKDTVETYYNLGIGLDHGDGSVESYDAFVDHAISTMGDY